MSVFRTKIKAGVGRLDDFGVERYQSSEVGRRAHCRRQQSYRDQPLLSVSQTTATAATGRPWFKKLRFCVINNKAGPVLPRELVEPPMARDHLAIDPLPQLALLAL